MKRAITIQTYVAFDPVPVPLNIIYNIGKAFGRLIRRKGKQEETRTDRYSWFFLGNEYADKYGESLPVADEDKFERVLREHHKTKEEHQQRFDRLHQLVSQVLCTASQKGDQKAPCVGPKMWTLGGYGIRIEGPLLTCHDAMPSINGAQYCKPFSEEFPYFEVVILETGEFGVLGIGVKNEDCRFNGMPGCYNKSVGYHIDDGAVHHSSNKKESKGSVKARQGDRIRCTIVFEEKEEHDGEILVPVVFSLNGRRITTDEGEDPFYIDCSKHLYPQLGMMRGASVLAKMLPREVFKADEFDIKVTKCLEKTKRKLKSLLARMADVKQEHDSSRLAELDKEVEILLEGTNQQLDALSARVTDDKENLQSANQC